MSDKDIEEKDEDMPEETLTELVEQRIESEGELSAASAEKEYAELIAEEASADESVEGDGTEDTETDTTPRARGLYRYVKISLPTLNKLIVVLCVALVICLLYGISDRGYMVDFDSRGGTPVESEKLMYSDKVIPPEEPYREGYIFTGWYTNADCTQPWDLDTGLVGGPMTLYAGWEKKDE